jgi:acetylornithine/N-succinyldiaminopimelate aminotransferase
VDEHLLRTYARAPEVFVEGQGAWLSTADGQRYLDLLGGIAVSALGHAHPRLVAALRDQVGRVLHTSNLYRHPYTEHVAAQLSRCTGLAAVFFANSGTEANECALKLARAHQERSGAPERDGFVALEGSFHGRTMGALSVTWNAKYRTPFEPLIPGVRFVPPGDAEALERALEQGRPAGLILEPIQGEGGIRPLPLDYLRAARELCDRTGTVLIHDEIQGGCGRSGPFLAADAAGIKPDVATLAKPLGAGVPIGATVVAERFARTLGVGDHGTTFGGGPLALRAASVFLELWESGELSQNVAERGAQFTAGLDRLVARFDHALERRGRGLMQGLRLETPAAEFVAALHRHGVLACTAGENVVRFLPPFVLTAADLQFALARLELCLQATAPCLETTSADCKPKT